MATSRVFVDKDVPSYVGFLPHIAVDPEGGIVLLADNSDGIPEKLGVLWRLVPPETEGRPDSDVGVFAARFDAILAALPERTHAQIHLRSTKESAAVFDTWSAGSESGDPVLAELVRSRRASLEALSIPTQTGSFESRGLDVLFGIVRPMQAGMDGQAAAPDDERALAYASDRRALLDLAKTLETLFSQAGLHAKRLGEEELVQELYARLNPGKSRSTKPPAAVPGEPIRERGATSQAALDLDQGDFVIDDIHHRVVSVVRLPDRSRAGMLFRSAAGSVLDAAPEFEAVINLHVLDQEALRASFAARRRLAIDQSRDVHQSPSMMPHAGELASLEQELAAGARVVSCRLSAIVRASTSSAAASRARGVSASLQGIGFRTVVETALAGSLFLTGLPLAYRSDTDRMIRRSRQALTMNVAHLLPFYGAFRGTPEPTQLLLNRRGEPVFLSIFNGKEVPHTVVTGKSGAGKSVFANDLILNALRTGGRIVVLDRGGSYERLTRMAGGVYVAYDKKTPLRINPCGIADMDGSCPDETNAFLRDWLTEMCTHGKADLPVAQQSLLSLAVRKAFAQKPGKEVVLSDLHQALGGLSTEHPVARELALCLSDFVGRGPYARFFDGPNQADFDKNPLIALDLADAALEDAVTSVLVMAIMQKVASSAKIYPSKDKYLVIDEAWTLLKSPASARFIENVARTARKVRLALVILSQQLTDLEGKTGEAILAQTSYKICLHQDAESIRKAAAILGLNVREAELYGSLRTMAGAYSELFIKSPFGSGVARLVMDPLSYWLTTSDMADRKLLEEILRKHESKGLSPREALRSALIETARKHPRGAGAR